MVLVVPHSGQYSMRSRTRRSVHNLVANPNASGPRLSACSIPRNWAGLSLARRPVCLALRKRACRIAPVLRRPTADRLPMHPHHSGRPRTG